MLVPDEKMTLKSKNAQCHQHNPSEERMHIPTLPKKHDMIQFFHTSPLERNKQLELEVISGSRRKIDSPSLKQMPKMKTKNMNDIIFERLYQEDATFHLGA